MKKTHGLSGNTSVQNLRANRQSRGSRFANSSANQTSAERAYEFVEQVNRVIDERRQQQS